MTVARSFDLTRVAAPSELRFSSLTRPTPMGQYLSDAIRLRFIHLTTSTRP